MSSHWSVQTNHSSSLERVARPFPLNINFSIMNRRRRVGLAGQTSSGSTANWNLDLIWTFPYILMETIYKVGGLAHETTIAMSHNRIEAASGVD